LPRRDDGTYYSTDPVEEIKGAFSGDEDDQMRIIERIGNARKYASLGARYGAVVPLGGSAVGSTLGAIGGFILGDKEIVFPIDMIAIPAYQAYLIQGSPAFQIYIKEGEVLNQVLPTDAMESEAALTAVNRDIATLKKKRKPSAYSKKYSKAFDSVKGKYKLKSGKWKKDGFKRAVRAAHKLAKGGKK